MKRSSAASTGTAFMAAVRAAAAAAAVAALAFVTLAAAGCSGGNDNTPPECPGDESFQVKVEGTCGQSGTVTIKSNACRLYLQQPSGYLGLPITGALAPLPRAVRQGNWTLYGDVEGGFRFCRATRTEWWIDLACLNSDTTPACQARLTE